MTRLRWFQIEPSISLKKITDNIKDNIFYNNSNYGFLIDYLRPNFIKGRYVEKIFTKDNITDPFGAEATYERVDYNIINFSIYHDLSLLEILNPPRSINTFINQISSITDFNITISKIKLNTMLWYNNFLIISNLNPIIRSILIRDINLENDVQAKIILSSNNDLKDKYKEIVNNKKHSLDKIQFHFSNPLNGKITLSQTGAAYINSEDPNKNLTDLLRQSLYNSI